MQPASVERQGARDLSESGGDRALPTRSRRCRDRSARFFEPVESRSPWSDSQLVSKLASIAMKTTAGLIEHALRSRETLIFF